MDVSGTPKQIISILADKNKSEHKKKKVVRFEEKTVFLNDQIENSGNAKGHFSVSKILEKISNEKSTNYVLSPRVSILKKSSLSEATQSPSPSFSKKSQLSLPSSYQESEQNECLSVGSLGSNDTLILEEEQDITNTFDASKTSFYEYESILFPKTSKYVDYLSNTSQIINLRNDKDENEETLVVDEPKKESKKDKKIITNEIPCNETIHLTLMSLELHANTRGNMHPDPEIDSIGFVCFTIYNQKPTNQVLFDTSQFETHLIVYDREKRSLSTSRYLGVLPQRKMFKSIRYAYTGKYLFNT